MLLELRDVRAGYGEAIVLDGISLSLPENGSLAVLGRNGVGKSTLMLTILGFTRLHRGQILWKGEDISRLAPHRRVQLGIGWVAQEREIFPSLDVEENLLVAARPGAWALARIDELFMTATRHKHEIDYTLRHWATPVERARVRDRVGSLMRHRP